MTLKLALKSRPRDIFNFLDVSISRRWKSLPRKIKEEKTSYHAQALDYFDDLYKPLYEQDWPSVRLALLSPAKKGVLVNNLSDKAKVSEYLKLQGALNVRKLFLEHQNCMKVESEIKLETVDSTLENKLEDIFQRKQKEDIGMLYPADTNPSSSLIENLLSDNRNSVESVAVDEDDDDQRDQGPKDPSQDMPLTDSLREADYDLSRLIVPSASGMMVGASLYDFVPATRLMGMDEFVPESAHFTDYIGVKDFPLTVVKEGPYEFPEALDIYAFDRGNCTHFPSPRKNSCGVLDYYEFDLAKLLLILALDVKSVDRVLDMMSLCGDTAMLIAQTLKPKIFVSNTVYERNATFMSRVFEDYFNANDEDCTPIITTTRPMSINDDLAYNKILLGVPNLHDRKAVVQDEDSYFHPLRAKERINLPITQKYLLRKALQLVDEGGTVVYFTQSLSPVQNEGVVLAALGEMWNTSGCRYVVKDMSESLKPLHQFMKIRNSEKCGHRVIPFLPHNYGPLYLCKIVKTFHDTNSKPNVQ